MTGRTGGAGVRVVTWNLWWRFGPWADRRKAILAVLRELEPDAVGLQEVWVVDGGENLAAWLAGELGLHCAWAPSPAPGRWQRRVGDDTVGIGTAVLSRRPVVERAVLRLPAPAELDDGRLALYARIDAPGHPVPFFTAHFTSGRAASAVRREQAAALAGFVDAHRHGTAHPPVVTGDLNARSDSPEVRLLRGPGAGCATPGSTPSRARRPVPGTPPTRTWRTWTRTAGRARGSTTSTWARPAPVASAGSGRCGGRVRAPSAASGPPTTPRSSPT
ncbi:endonuclease/exonuclease/phosphatase family protein [Streptomyces sp. NBUA17]|uniref:endonuclease/exonuclease/phosphatase family protein n=1 Tax=Streptomyces sp. NBUA17 TaxID=3062275 RepID=UPI0037DA090C